MVEGQPADAAPSRHPRLVLVDGNNYLWRAYHAGDPKFRADGTSVNALQGFVVGMLRRLTLKSRASHLAVVFDADGPSFRREIHPGYKAERPETPPDLAAQMKLAREASDSFSVAWVESPGFEADDLFAAYARAAKDRGLKVSLVSNDTSLLQLVDDRAGVSVYHPQKEAVLREADVVEKFGVRPALVPDVLALAGKSGDGVPGVKGIGQKIAAELVQQHGSLEGVLAGAAEIPQAKRRQRLLEGGDDARLSARLVKLRDDAPLPLPLDDLRAREPNGADVRAFLARNEIEAPGPWHQAAPSRP